MTTRQLLKRGATIALFLCLLTAMISGMAVRAGAAGERQLPEGFLIGDQDGVNADKHGYYHIDARELLPGDVIRKTLTIQNLSQSDSTPEGKIPYTLVMTAEPLFSRGPVDLLNVVHLNMKLGGVTVYDGRSRGDGTPDMTINPLQLGVYAVGDRKTLEITLTVARDMEIHGEKSEADFRWHFYAYRTLEAPPAKTGVLDNYLYLLPVGCVMLLFVAMVPLKKRRERSEKRP
ncbi:MAG: hypothetical protein FWC27_02255 [Firmicutes bacterium]|nr:hypothetical protein [Bacillota bacterium]